MKIVPKKHDGFCLTMRMSCGSGASSSTVRVA